MNREAGSSSEAPAALLEERVCRRRGGAVTVRVRARAATGSELHRMDEAVRALLLALRAADSRGRREKT